jgi:pyruvate kinase
MDVMRINCAHDDSTVWKAMVQNLHKAERKVGRLCKVQANLAGPKLRTGRIDPIGRVMKIKPNRDQLGRAVLPDVIVPISLYPRDILNLTRSNEPGRDAMRSAVGMVEEPARIHCTFEAAFDQVKAGERVWFDDGKIGGIVRVNNGDEIHVEINRTGPAGARLGSEKGINFPDTLFDVPPLTEKDLQDLEHILGFVDMIALSFLRGPEDVALLEDHLHRLGAGHLGIVLKIENRQAFENLPRILHTSLSSPPVGVMVA